MNTKQNTKTKKQLIVNADDFGMTLSISKGILKAAKGNVVQSTTVMTTSHDFDASMNELMKSGIDLDIGFHANLTWGQPISEPEEIRSLVNDQGLFLPRLQLLWKAIKGKISEEEVYKEFKAQLLLLRDKHPSITHMDGHHHVHAFPVICKAAEKVAKEFNIPFMRSPVEGLWSPISWAGPRRFVVSLLTGAKPAYWKEKGFSTSDNFGGFALSAGPSILRRWYKTLSHLHSGLTEIMVHPGHFSPQNDGYNIEREEEIWVLANPYLAETAHNLGVEITNFKNLLK